MELQSAARLPLDNNPVDLPGEVDWSKCIICQENKLPKKKFPLSKGSAAGVSRILYCAEIREKYGDDKQKHCSSVVDNLKTKEENQDVVWHRYCYSDFTSEGHIKRVLKKQESESKPDGKDAPANEPSRRSSVRRIDWSKCIFCQTDVKKVALNQVQTFQTSQKILLNVTSDRELSCRLAGVSDLIAAEGKYHLKCYARFLRNTERNAQCSETDDANRCFEEVMTLLRERLSQGHILSLKAVWTYFSHQLEEKYQLSPGDYRSNRFKERIQTFRGEDIAFVPPLNPSEPHLIVYANLGEAALRSLLTIPINESDDDDLNGDATEDVDLDAELLSWLYRVAVKVHHDIKVSPNHDCIGKISKASAEEIVPESLIMLISQLCTGYQEEFQESQDDMKTCILSICQDIIFLSSKGHKLTPKHIGIALTVHQATRSKQLLQLLHAADHSVNYDTVLRMDNTIANDVLERYRESGNVFVPRNFTGTTNPAGYTRFAVDNIDINEETLNGMGTFHATQVAAFRRKEEGEPAMDIELSPKSERRLDVQVPSELHELTDLSLYNKKPEPQLQKTVVSEWCTPESNLIDESYKKDLAWILGA